LILFLKSTLRTGRLLNSPRTVTVVPTGTGHALDRRRDQLPLRVERELLSQRRRRVSRRDHEGAGEVGQAEEGLPSKAQRGGAGRVRLVASIVVIVPVIGVIAETIAGVAMTDGCEKKWREGDRVMSDPIRCGEMQKMQVV
jgi:hypothetical protein